MRCFSLCLVLFCCALHLQAEPDDVIRRVHSHIVIGDYQSAAAEAKAALKTFQQSKPLWELYIQAVAKSGDEKALMNTWKQYIEHFPDEKQNNQVLEILAWGVIEKGSNSTAPVVRLTAILGAFFSQDSKGIAILKNAMSDEHAFIRAAAVKLSSRLLDNSLQDEVLRLIRNEKVWKVRLEAIQAAGEMRILDARPDLMKIIGQDDLHVEEKTAAIGSLVQISDHVDRSHLSKLAMSNRAAIRLLACELIAHYELVDDLDLLYPLLGDSHADVRQKAFEAVGRLRLDEVQGKNVVEIALKGTHDPDPVVAVTAAWVLMLNDKEKGQKALSTLLNHSSTQVRHLAAAALSASGSYGLPLMAEVFQNENDLYIKMNLALGLIGQRILVSQASDCLYNGLTTLKEKWAWTEEGQFKCLAPSKVKHDEAIPNYPEAMNQLTRLEVLQTLAVLQYPRAQEAVKEFLKESNWGITGIASALLLTEGDQEAIDLVKGLLNDPDKKVRVQAALILALWGKGEDSVQMLQTAYPTADREQKGQLLEGIGRVRSQVSLPFLAECLQEPFPTLRIIAAAALLECLNH